VHPVHPRHRLLSLISTRRVFGSIFQAGSGQKEAKRFDHGLGNMGTTYNVTTSANGSASDVFRRITPSLPSFYRPSERPESSIQRSSNTCPGQRDEVRPTTEGREEASGQEIEIISRLLLAARSFEASGTGNCQLHHTRIRSKLLPTPSDRVDS
jgi:hypothetical protein